MTGIVQRTAGRTGTVMATRGVVASGHYLASQAGANILQQGGNAVDAGVAAGLVLNVIHSDMNSFGGVAPIILYDAAMDSVRTFRGVGWWAAAMTPNHFNERYGGDIPDGNLAKCVVPGAPDAWLRALKEHGTMRFEQVVDSALEYAKNGFPATEFTILNILARKPEFSISPDTAALFLPNNGEPPEVGQRVIQPDLANTFETLIQVERENSDKGRQAALQALRDYFYRGPIAEKMAEHAAQGESLLELHDFNDYEALEYPSLQIDFGRYTVHSCGPWCQGPVVPMALNILKNFDLKAMGQNSPEYIHTVAGALNLAFSDRHYFMGDPAHVAVPIDGFLSEEYGRERAMLIKPQEAFQEMPPPGDPWKFQDPSRAWPDARVEDRTVYHDMPVPTAQPHYKYDRDTSYVCAADRFGNFFSATPSDGIHSLIPDLGIAMSERGVQTYADPNNPNAAGPRKCPRLTPSPGLIFRDGKPWAAYGTPGGDRQPQAMLQFFLNMAVFEMTPQEALHAPRFASYNFPLSPHPHQYLPGRIFIERRIPEEIRETLSSWGHDVEAWPEYIAAAGAPCISIRDPETEIFYGAADNRRQSQAVGI